MFRRKKLTAQEKADRRWERMQASPRTMGLVGIFNDLTPGQKHAEQQIQAERLRSDDVANEGDGPMKITLPRRTPPEPRP